MNAADLEAQWRGSLSPEQSALYNRMLAPNTEGRRLIHQFCRSCSQEQWALYSAYLSARIGGDV
jgi:hypothetical protein